MNSEFPTPELISDDQTLKARCQQWQQLPILAMDTEFVRTDTFYARLGLIQISDGKECWLIDPLALSDLSPLSEVFKNPAIIKIFHSPSEDLEILRAALGCLPEPIFDSQVAAALTGYGFSKGYAALVKALLNVDLEKHETRSDWTRRPLSEQQLHYAAEDVYYLAALYPLLLDKLAEMQRQQWMDEEMATLLVKSAEAEDLDGYYRKIKMAWQLDDSDLLLLQQLCRWRELQAREIDRPRNRVVSDKLLFEIARQKPRTLAALKRIEGMHPGTVRRFGEKLLELVGAADAESSGADSLPPLDQPLPKSAAAKLKKLRAVVLSVSERLDLPAEVLAKRRDLEAIVRSARSETPPGLPDTLATGWRFQVVGDPLLKLAQELWENQSQ